MCWGLGVAIIADGFRCQIGTGDFVANYAEKAAKASGETAYVVGWIEDEIVVLGAARGDGNIQAGEVSRGTPATRAPNTITSRSGLVQELHRIREGWFAVERENIRSYCPALRCLSEPCRR